MAKKDAQRQVHDYLARALAVSAPTKIQVLMKKNGVNTLNEFIALCDQEREELYGELKIGGVVLGDRSKLRRATPDAVANWLTMEPTITQKRKTSFISKLFGDSSDNNIIRRSMSGTGTLDGSPAWWKEHDAKIKKMAVAIKVNQPAYSWQQHSDNDRYQQILWERREQIMKQGFASDNLLRKEWLALVLELDAAISTSESTDKQLQTYSWYSQKNLSSYKVALLQRRSELLKKNLTTSSSLQAEWVVLMRELEITLQEQWEAERDPKDTAPNTTTNQENADDDDVVDDDDVDLMKMPIITVVQNDTKAPPDVDEDGKDGTKSTGGRIQSWRNEVAKTLLKKSDSMTSLLSDDGSEFTKSDMTRVASLASFYDCDEFFSGSEAEEDKQEEEEEVEKEEEE